MTEPFDPSDTPGSDGKESEFADACPPGTVIGELTLHDAIGQGGEGIVYRATWRGRPVLAKEYRPAMLASRASSGPGSTVRASRSSWQAQYRRSLERFIQQGEKMRSLPPHQNVVRVHDVIEGLGTAYLVMDEVRGPSLAALLDHYGTCSPQQAFRLADQLSQTLEFLERENLVHRDISPDNLIVSDPGNWSIVLIDFNAAKDLSVLVSQSTAGLVKPGYSALEQYGSAPESYGIASDIYSAGAVLYRAITGHPPVEAARRSFSSDHQPLTALALADYDPAFLGAIDHALELRPEDRPQSATMWREELGLVYRGGAGTAGSERAAPKPRPSGQEQPRAAAPNPARDEPAAAAQTFMDGEEPRVPLPRFQYPLGIIVIVAAVLLSIAWTAARVPGIIEVEQTVKRAEAALAAGDLNQAIEIYGEIIGRDPQNHDALFGLVTALLRDDSPVRHGEAIALIRENWLSDDEYAAIDVYLTPEDRLALAAPDRYGTTEEPAASESAQAQPAGKQDVAGQRAAPQPKSAADIANERYGTFPEEPGPAGQQR